MSEEIRLIEERPTIRRPLSLIGDHAYAASWLSVEVREYSKTQKGKSSQERRERRVFILRDDGRLFDQDGRISWYMVGRSIRFKQDDLDSLVERGYHPAQPFGSLGGDSCRDSMEA